MYFEIIIKRLCLATIAIQLSQGDEKERKCMLLDFIEKCDHFTAPELEQQFHNCASLFNARIIVWLRIS